MANLVTSLSPTEPWPGSFSYEEADADYFCGRREEVVAVRSLVLRDRLSLLYGVSGLGKTSLLNAGLFPRLRAEDYLPISVRLKHEDEASAASLSGDVLCSIFDEATERGVEAPRPLPGESLWHYFHRESFALWNSRQRPVTPVIIIDQFEELFTLGQVNECRRQRARDFLEDFSALLEERIPASADRARGGQSERIDYLAPSRLHAVLTMREDFLPHLFGMRELLPSLRRNEMRLLPLNQVGAQEVINVPGREIVEHDVADAILDYFSTENGDAALSVGWMLPSMLPERPVDPAWLSLLLHGLNELRKKQALPKITAGLAKNNVREVLDLFYASAFEELTDAPAIERYIADELISPSGFRESRSLDSALAHEEISRETIDHLVRKRVLRYEVSAGGLRRIELAHDVLCRIIRSRQATLKFRELEEQREIERNAVDEQRRATERLSEQFAAKRIRIYISTSADVAYERAITNQVIAHLQIRHSGRLFIEPYFWEHEPVRVADDPSVDMPRIEEFDIAIFVVWRRLGPPVIRTQTGEMSGTEYTFGKALQGWRATGHPEILMFRRTEAPSVSLENREAARQAMEDYVAVQDFFQRHFADGHVVHSCNSYNQVKDFEALLTGALSVIVERELPDKSAGVSVWKTWQRGNPYTGLRPFDFDDAPIFFGRTQAAEMIISHLQRRAAAHESFVLIAGATGVGKTSVMQAGVFPLLMQSGVIEGHVVVSWGITQMRSTGSPFEVLASTLLTVLPTLRDIVLVRDAPPQSVAENGWQAPALARLLSDEPVVAAKAIREGILAAASEKQRSQARSVKENACIVVGLDKLEHMFSGDCPQTVRTAFFRLIHMLARGGDVWFVATMGSDFLPYAQTDLELAALIAEGGLYFLAPPTVAELAQMIRMPAQAAGIRFEMDSGAVALDDVILNAASRNPEAIALLEFTLQLLYESDGSAGLLRRQTYESIGGLDGAMTTLADRVFTEVFPVLSEYAPASGRHHAFPAFGSSAKAMMRTLEERHGQAAICCFQLAMRHLVAVGANGPVRRFPSKGALEADADQKRLIDHLLASRLLVADLDGQSGGVSVGLAHEALLDKWPMLVAYIEIYRENLKIRERLAADARAWHEAARSPHFLYLDEVRLEEARRLLAEGFVDDESERDFILLSSIEGAERSLMKQLEEISRPWDLDGLNSTVILSEESRRKVLGAALQHPSNQVRGNAAAFLGYQPLPALLPELVGLVIHDRSDKVRRAAARSLAGLDEAVLFDNLFEGLKSTHSSFEGTSRMIGGIARVRIAAEENGQIAADFFERIAHLPHSTRMRIWMRTRSLRFISAIPALLVILIPQILLSMCGASLIGGVVGALGYTNGQPGRSQGVGLFLGMTTAFFSGSFITCYIILYELVFSESQQRSKLCLRVPFKIYLRPWGSLVAGTAAGLMGSFLVMSIKCVVYSGKGLYMMGWSRAEYSETSASFRTGIWHDLVCETGYLWPQLLTGAALGFGMAMVFNALKGSLAWQEFRLSQSRLTSVPQLARLISQLMRLMLAKSWPIFIMLAIASVSAFGVMRCFGQEAVQPAPVGWREILGLRFPERAEDQRRYVRLYTTLDAALNDGSSEISSHNLPLDNAEDFQGTVQSRAQYRAANESFRRWKISPWGQALGLFGDAQLQVAIGFFSMVGIGLGLIVLTKGVEIRPSDD